MVHLAPDSRLLVSLVKQEQAYASQLHNLLNASGSSLSALAVYASSAPPSISPVLTGVAAVLSGADEALRSYGEALNNWIDQLGSIKRKEEQVANIGRDREILVTRLLKASQKSRSPPPSLLHAAPDPSSNSSFPTFSSKISAAQSELQACESHLAETERELERVRVHAIKQGLKQRCTALVQCAWVWHDMGRRALAILDEIDGVRPPSNGYAPEFFKPLPDPTNDDHDSVLSSLSPSQSASQIGVIAPAPLLPEKSYRLDIPPAHLVSENNVIPASSAYPDREGGNSSSEDEGPVEVHENPRFQSAPVLNRRGTQGKSTRTTPSLPSRASPVPLPSPSPSKSRGTSSDIGPSGREKKGLFGSLALLFRTSMASKPNVMQRDGQWSSMRTDRNLRSVKSDGGESSDEEESQLRTGRLRKSKGRASPGDEAKKGRGSDDLIGGTPLPMPFPTSAPATVKKKSGGKLGRAGTFRSTVSEPAPAPRVRASTLTTASSGPALAAGAAVARRHGWTASVDGRWGLSGAGSSSTASLHNPSSPSTWKPSTQMPTKGDSLMSIVEGVSRSNQAAWAHAHDDPSSRLELARAPGSSVPNLPLLVHPPPPLPTPSSAPVSRTSSQTAAPRRSSMPVPSTSMPHALSAAEKKPLRSALRNSNRDRSASPSSSPSPRVPASDSEPSSSPSRLPPLSLPGSSSPLTPRHSSSVTRPGVPSTIAESPRQSMVDTTTPQHEPQRQSWVSTKTDDSASISSYETGHENFDEEVPEPPPSAPPPANEKVSPPRSSPDTQPALDGLADQHEMSSATSTDTATGAGPSRRKSVRMSTLPPQVSATPPALDEYEDADRSPWGKPQSQSRAAPRDEGWNTRIPTNGLAWDDSSSEDETYKAARRMLSRADRRSERNRR